MNRVLENVTLASAPYLSSLWKAISTGNIMEASPLAMMSAAKEHYFQYQELVKDSLAASLYVDKTAIYIEFLKQFKLCNLTLLTKAHTELSDMVKTLLSDKGIHEQLEQQQKLMNQTLKEYNTTHDVNKYVKNLQSLGDKMFVKSWPGWYRTELNSQINRLNVMIDDAQMDIAQGSHACSRRARSPRISMKPPVELDNEDEDIFFDAVTSPQPHRRNAARGGAARRRK
jgi:hypothetical protein